MRRIAIAMLAAVLVLAACGGSSSNKSNGNNNSKSLTNSGSSGSGSGSGSGLGSGSGSGSGSGTGNSDFDNLVSQYAKANVKVTYTSSDGSTITVAQDGNGKSAFTSNGSTIYTDGKSTVSCDGTGSSAKCTDLGSLGSSVGGTLGSSFSAIFAALAGMLRQLGVGNKSSTNIAGRDATCETYKASDVVSKLGGISLFKGAANSSDYDPNDTATICVDNQTGFVLRVEDTKKGAKESVFEATSFSTPTSSDFTPPVTPQTVPKVSLPPGVTLPPGITLPGSNG